MTEDVSQVAKAVHVDNMLLCFYWYQRGIGYKVPKVCLEVTASILRSPSLAMPVNPFLQTTEVPYYYPELIVGSIISLAS